MAAVNNIAAAEALVAGRIVANVSGNGWAYVDDTTVGPVMVTSNSCASGEYPELYELGDEMLITTGGSVTANTMLGATTDGVAVSVTPTGAAAAWTVGYTFTADSGTLVRAVFNPQYHAADAA